MSTVANSITNPTLFDALREKSPGGAALRLIESMRLRIPLMNFVTWQECNSGLYHRISRQRALPAPVRRRTNQGVAATVGHTQQVDEVTTQLADKAVVDEDVVQLSGPVYRMNQVQMHTMAMHQKFESDLIYGSIGSDPDGIDGLIMRLGGSSTFVVATAQASAPGGGQIIDVDGAAASGSDQASILLIGFAPHGVHAIYPGGMSNFLDHKDYGLQEQGGTDGTNTFPAYVDWWKWNYGLAVEDYEYVARACNIDMSAISNTGTNIIDALIDLRHKCRTEDASARWVFVAPADVTNKLDHQARSGTTNSTLSIREFEGIPCVSAFGYPILTCDKMLTTEGEGT